MAIYIGIGSNLGDRLKNLNDCMAAFSIVKKSSFYETEPVGFLEQPWFLNAVIQVNWNDTGRNLLRYCQNIESQLGRKREVPKGPRTIDIDILFFDQLMIHEPDLVIPHPEIPNRRFVLEPLNEMAPDFVHPLLQKTISELLTLCRDPSQVTLWL